MDIIPTENMSGRADKKSKRRRREKDRADDDDQVVRKSLIDYSKVADRHVDDNRFEKHRQASSTPSAADAGPPAASTAASASSAQSKVSSQMAAVMRIMAGKEERTIAEKLADSNRPTWEQYKKDNEDKLDLVGLDQKKMEAYRKELDEQRDMLLTRGTNHQKEVKGGRKAKKKRKKKHKRHDDSHSSDSGSSDDYSSDDGRRSHKRKKYKKRSNRKRSSRRYDSDSYDSDSEDNRKKSSKHKKKKDRKRGKSDEEGGGDSYRLSSFFTKGSDDDRT